MAEDIQFFACLAVRFAVANDVIVECTGLPIAAVDHCLGAFAHGG